MSDDTRTELLDIEFRQILYIIKPLINKINDRYKLERYRVWLERLSNSVDPSEKLERNRYLLELANQIHDQVLKFPFTHNPSKNHLPSLRSVLQIETASRTQHEEVQWPYLTPRRSQTEEQNGSKRGKERVAKGKITQPFQKIGKTVVVKSETSSWCDLSDSTAIGEEERDKPSQQELEALKQRMKDLLEVKNALKDTHYLTEDRKKTIEVLQENLTRAQQENTDLQNELDSLKTKDQVQTKELDDLKFSRQQELECLKRNHKRDVIALENHYSTKVAELEAKIKSLQEERDSKVRLVKDMEDEIQQLRNHLSNNTEQVNNLRRYITKLDKMFSKNEKEYYKKIAKLKQEIEVKDMASQMQLQTQRADFVVKANAVKQEELKNALNSLEGKYKKMLENLQTHALLAKKQDDRVIDELKSLLIENNITC